MPVALPPGRLRLVTSPSFTGSSATANTMGTVFVADLAASAAGELSGVAITAAWRCTRSAARGREPLVALLGPAIFDRDVLPFDIAALGEPLAKCRNT